jgi:hypothetical protein
MIFKTQSNFDANWGLLKLISPAFISLCLLSITFDWFFFLNFSQYSNKFDEKKFKQQII